MCKSLMGHYSEYGRTHYKEILAGSNIFFDMFLGWIPFFNFSYKVSFY